MTGRQYTQTLLRALHEAQDIARANHQTVTSAHMLLSFFVLRNPAERLLRHRGVDEDRLLEQYKLEATEAPDVVHEIMARTAQVAASCGSEQAGCLHMLVAISRSRDALAYAMLAGCDKLSVLRTRALAILTGDMPRWQNSPEASELPLPEPLPASEPDGARDWRPSRSQILNRPQRPERKPAISWRPPLIPPDRPRRPGRHEPPAHKRAARSLTHGQPAPPPPKPQEGLQARGVQLGGKASEGEPLVAPSRQLEDEVTIRPPPSVPVRPATRSAAPTPKRSEKPRRAAQSSLRPEPSAKPIGALDPQRFPWLSQLGRDLSAEAAAGKLDRLIGREREVEQLIDVLGKRRANNPILLGEPGVGKTAVVEGLAQRLLKLAPSKTIVSLDVGGLLVGTQLRGAFSEKLAGIKDEVRRARGRVIIFFDEIHTLIGAGAGDGPLDAGGELKAALSRGDFACIGATTWDEYKQHFEGDPALSRRFSPVNVPEPSPAEAVAIIKRIVPAYGRHHEVSYPEAAVAAAVDLSVRFIPDRRLPDKAIALLDLAGSRAARTGARVVSAQLVAALVAERAELPVERLLASDADRLLNLESELSRQVIGHQAAIERIAEVVRRGAAGFRSHRPVGVFLLVGPTGVGKTETAKALARSLHGSESALIRFDLSEFSEAHTVARLVGSPPGYVGFEAGGQLTEQVRARPGRIILFDELEKAHRDVLQLLLQILDEGQLTDAQGRKVSFADCVIMMTSNLGAELSQRRGIGFSGGGAEDLEAGILDRAKAALAPELWGRIEDKLVFSPLARPELRQIASLLAASSSARLNKERGISYQLEDSALDWLIDQGGADARFGARPLRQTLSRLVEGPIAARILEGRLHAGQEVWVRTRNTGGLLFSVGRAGPSLSQLPARA